MNLLYFTQFYYPAIFGGGEYIFYLITRELARRGHNVHVVCQKLINTSFYEEFAGVHIHRVGSDYAFAGTLPPTIGYNIGYLLHAFRKGRRLILEKRKQEAKFDLIHSNTFVPAFCGDLCSRLYHIPHIVTFHDVYQTHDTSFWNQWMSKQRTAPKYAAFAGKIVEKLVLKLRVRTFHTVSEMTKSDLLASGVDETRICVVPNGISQSEYETHGIAEQHQAIFVGRLIFYKNVETVIRAFKLVVKEIPDARLVIVGDGPSKASLVEEAKDIKNNILFTGIISHNEKVKLINASKFMVFPSLIEGFGIAIIEAFACSKPAIVANVRPPSDIVNTGVTGYVVEAFDIDDWSEKMMELFKNDELRRSLGVNAHNVFEEKYELQKIVDQIESIYYDN